MNWWILFGFIGCDTVIDHYGAAADPSDTKKIVFTVPKGASPRTIGKQLEQSKIIVSHDNFTMYVKLTKEGSCIKAGRFALSRSMDAKTILTTLCGTPLPNDVPFTVVEGWRIRDIDAALVKKKLIQPGEYITLAKDPTQFKAAFPLPTGSLEGYLYPETYMITPDRFTVKSFINRQLETFDKVFYQKHLAAIKNSKRPFQDNVIMASMLEREEPKPKNRPMVAGILWKRLDSKWKLGVDATSRYTLAKWNDRKAFMKKLRNPNDIYNTRMRHGLPPTPIGNPSVDSLQAALNPVSSPYWYYLHDHQKNLHPSRNVKEHEAYRKKYNVY